LVKFTNSTKRAELPLAPQHDARISAKRCQVSAVFLGNSVDERIGGVAFVFVLDFAQRIVDSGRLHRFSPLSTALQLLDGIQPNLD
jgi:hypothetical protein